MGPRDGSTPLFITFFLHIPLPESPNKDIWILTQASSQGLDTQFLDT